jgi:hypothetical protein
MAVFLPRSARFEGIPEQAPITGLDSPPVTAGEGTSAPPAPKRYQQHLQGRFNDYAVGEFRAAMLPIAKYDGHLDHRGRAQSLGPVEDLGLEDEPPRAYAIEVEISKDARTICAKPARHIPYRQAEEPA